MDVNKGFYLPDCLDEQTIVYFSSGLDNSAGGYKVFSKVELIEEIARILAVPASSLLDRGACYDSILCGALDRFWKMLTPESDKRIGSPTEQIKEIVRSVMDSSSIRSDDMSFVDLSWRMSDIYYPYLMLFVLEPYRPEWLMVNHRTLDIAIRSGLLAIESLKYSWNGLLYGRFNSEKESAECSRLLFVITLLVVLRNEVGFLNTCEDLTNLPVEIPQRRSSSFLRIKTLDFRDIHQYASLLLGIYEELGKGHSQSETKLMERIKRQIDGCEDLGIVGMRPMPFTEWQTKAIMADPETLDPVFAALSTLRYHTYSNGSEIARLYYEYMPYQATGKEKRKLFINHFFPYIALSSDDVVLSDVIIEPMVNSSGEYTGEFMEKPVCVEGIDTGLMDMLYLHFNRHDVGNLRQLRRTESSGQSDKGSDISDLHSFDIIQGERIDTNTVKRYHQFLSNCGEWKQVKDRFEAEVERRVTLELRHFRHNILQHFGHLEKDADAIVRYIENDRMDRVLELARSSRRGIRRSLAQLAALSTDKTNFKRLPFNLQIQGFIDDLPSNERSVKISWNKGNVPDDMMFPFVGDNGFLFYIMMQNVVKNAYDHGFNVKDPEFKMPPQPEIMIEADIINDVLRLRIMNNGKPLPEGFDKHDYITSGFTTSTGNTGLGGAQIDAIVRQHGGTLEIGRTEEWNFILQIEFKI